MNLAKLYDKLYIDLKPRERRLLKAEIFLYMRKNPPNVEFIGSDKQLDSVTLTFEFEADYFGRIAEDFISKSEFGPRLSAIYHANL